MPLDTPRVFGLASDASCFGMVTVAPAVVGHLFPGPRPPGQTAKATALCGEFVLGVPVSALPLSSMCRGCCSVYWAPRL